VAPDDLRILNTWGLCLSELNYWDQALDKYAQARRADPKSPYPYRNAIYLLRSLGRDEEAARIEDDWKRAKGSAPLNPRP
jgi:tetratricopeptide (TPR) repeat protein